MAWGGLHPPHPMCVLEWENSMCGRGLINRRWNPVEGGGGNLITKQYIVNCKLSNNDKVQEPSVLCLLNVIAGYAQAEKN